MLLKRKLVDFVEPQVGKQFDSSIKLKERSLECLGFLLICSLNSRWVLDAPMRGNGMPGPDGADFPSRLITHRKNKVHYRRIRPGELIPALAAQIGGRHFGLLESIQCEWMHGSLWEAASAESFEAARAPMVDQRFCHNAARRVARTEKQNIVFRHRFLTSSDCSQQERVRQTQKQKKTHAVGHESQQYAGALGRIAPSTLEKDRHR